MRRELKTKTGRLQDLCDLTVAAPIRRGMVPSLDAVSYKTRTERVLRLLQGGRQGLHEFDLTRVLADAVERVGLIHAVRVAIVEPGDLLMLSVTFDGDWQPYMRVVWQKVARLLDLLFCNTENYVCGWEHSYEEWMAWLRRHQVSTPFFYAQPGLSYGDGVLLRSQEWVLRQKAGQGLEARRMTVPNADLVEDALAEPWGRDPRAPGSASYPGEHGGSFLLTRQSVRSLAALHRLCEVYLPGTHDGWVLHRAACETLAALRLLFSSGSLPGSENMQRFLDALQWLGTEEPDPPPARKAPPLQQQLTDVLPLAEQATVQAGILSSLPKVRHGCVLLLGFKGSVDFAAFLQGLQLTHERAPFRTDGISVNLALSTEGLRLAGFSDEELRQWPDAFYEGMAARAGLLGDVRANHPRAWRLPPRNAADGVRAVDELPDTTTADPDDPAAGLPGAHRVALAEVHALLQLRLKDVSDEASARTQLWQAALNLCPDKEHRLSVQWLRRLGQGPFAEEHFGWFDAQTGPVFDRADASPRARDHVHVGEALCGHANAVDARWPAATDPAAEWLHNGSFLVVRKLRQDVQALETAAASSQLPADQAKALLMGRWPAGSAHAGEPLADPMPPANRPNNFSFAGDPSGRTCPLHAHIRRANPRTPAGSLSDPKALPEAPVRPPRLMRRGMSYGKPFAEAPGDERGLFFMAYNASLAEQFEVMQHWLSGANSAGGDSAQADPLLGVAVPGQARVSLIEEGGQLHRITLEPACPLGEEPRALVRLQWGAYFFAPSLPVLARIASRAAAQGPAPAPKLWDAARGERDIQALLALEAREGAAAGLQAWKNALEDPDSLAEYRAQSIWAAIREQHGGQLRCAYGVLVASPEGVAQVLGDAQRCTVQGYLERMRFSFGPIFLGADAGQADGRYERESAGVIEAIQALPAEATYARARQLVADKLLALQAAAVQSAHEGGDGHWRLGFEVRELIDPMLGTFCTEWFGLDKAYFQAGGIELSTSGPARNPGHFASPSRFFFQPHPNAEVERIGNAHGQALRAAMQAQLDKGVFGNAPLMAAVRANPLAQQDPSYVARTVIGVIMGFVPTVEGTLRRVLADWMREGTLWRLRGRSGALPLLANAMVLMKTEFIRAMQMRVAPELLWRTAALDHALGSGAHTVAVKAGDRVVAGLLSATAAHWEQGQGAYHEVFGGDRDQAGHPTHACPGTKAAWALMLGFLAALLESKLPLRAGPMGLSFEAEGRFQTRRSGGNEERVPASVAARQFTTRVPMMALGDSWLTLTALQSLTRSLGELGYDCSWTHNIAKPSWTLEAISRQSEEVLRRLPDVELLLIDGGGNDVHQDNPNFFATPFDPLDWATLTDHASRRTLDDLLLGKGAQATLNPAAVEAFIDVHLGGLMQSLLTKLSVDPDRPPIVIVAYDHPFPDGRALFRPWLKPAFDRRGIDLRHGHTLMTELIERLNARMEKLADTQKKIYMVRLTGQLPATLANYKDWWTNELHPTAQGFDKLAAHLVTELTRLNLPVPKP